MNNECGFKIGDIVIDTRGRKGKIIDICYCSFCEERGFYEPDVEFEDGGNTYITCWDKEDDFSDYIKIGKQTFNVVNDENILEMQTEIEEKQAEIRQLRKQIKVLERLKGG